MSLVNFRLAVLSVSYEFTHTSVTVTEVKWVFYDVNQTVNQCSWSHKDNDSFQLSSALLVLAKC